MEMAEKVYRILVINPGSTSTKVSLFEDEREVFEKSLFHDAPVLLRYPHVNDQIPFRYQVILDMLKEEGVAPEEIDFVLVSTVQAETLSPALACDIQPALGLKCMGMDLNAGCTGFIAALSVAEGLIASKRARRILKIGRAHV